MREYLVSLMAQEELVSQKPGPRTAFRTWSSGKSSPLDTCKR